MGIGETPLRARDLAAAVIGPGAGVVSIGSGSVYVRMPAAGPVVTQVAAVGLVGVPNHGDSRLRC